MAFTLPTFRIDPLREDRLDLAPTPPVFLRLTAELLGNAATGEDGFPSLVVAAALGLDNLKMAAESLDPLINTWAAAGEVVSIDTLPGEREALESDVQIGHAIVSGVQAGLTLPARALPTITVSQFKALPVFGPTGAIATALEIQAGLIQLISG